MNMMEELQTIPLKRPETREENMKHSLFAPENFKHYMAVADFLSKSSMVPKNMIGKPSDILIAMEMGFQLGMSPMQAIQDIAVINGKPCMYGDGLLAVVQGHADFEYIKEYMESDSVAVCTIKRKNHEEKTVRFTKSDAMQAGLWDKSGPWKQYPKRMLQMRARGFCLRDAFADALRGIKSREEVQDYELADITPKQNNTANKLKALMKGRNEPLQKPKADVIDVKAEDVAQASDSDRRRADTAGDSSHDNTNTSKANESLVLDIYALLEEKQITPERKLKALAQFGAIKVEELNEEDARTLIDQLQRISS